MMRIIYSGARNNNKLINYKQILQATHHRSQGHSWPTWDEDDDDEEVLCCCSSWTSLPSVMDMESNCLSCINPCAMYVRILFLSLSFAWSLKFRLICSANSLPSSIFLAVLIICLYNTNTLLRWRNSFNDMISFPTLCAERFIFFWVWCCFYSETFEFSSLRRWCRDNDDLEFFIVYI